VRYQLCIAGHATEEEGEEEEEEDWGQTSALVISGEASIPGEKAGGGKRPGRKLSALDSSEDAILSARSRPTGGCQADVAEMQKLDGAIDWAAAAAPRRRRGARPPPATSRLGDTNVKCRS